MRSGSWHAEALVTRPQYRGEPANHIHIGSDWEEAMKAYGQASSERWVLIEDLAMAFAGSATFQKWLLFNVGQ